MKKYNFSADPFSRAFLENRDKTMNERVAAGMLEAAHYLPITFPENCMLPTVGTLAKDAAVGYAFGLGIFYNPGEYTAILEKNPEHKDEIEDIKRQMARFNTNAIWERNCTFDEMRLRGSMAYWGGGWGGHANPAFGKLPLVGTDGIRREIEENRKKNPGKDHFYDACVTAMAALDVLGDRISAMAKQNAETETDPAKRAEWERIADTFTRVPRQPAKDFYEAVMVYWMLYSVDGIDSPGRFDQEMIGFYRNSPEAERRDMLRRFLEAMHNVRGWNLCISGSDENWNDETNELSYDILEAVTEMGYQTPNLTMRVHRNTPEKLWQMAAKSLSTGTGLPAIYNDEVVCAALEEIGIPPCDSHDYCMNGCNQIDIMGKSHMGLEDGEVNLGKVLELTIHNGYDFKSGGTELISIQTGNPRECETFEDFLKIYYAQMDFVTDVAVRTANASQEAYARYAPNPMRSCLIEGCLEKGKDYKWGGPLYGYGQILAEGIADAADSLYAMKKLIFDEKKYTMDELIRALEANYEGYDELHHDFATCPKFGNDIPEVDDVASEIVDHFFRYLKTKNTFRGGMYTGGCSPFNRASDNGLGTAALPNGRRDGDANYADSIAATPGCDTHGPTASLKSMMRYHQTEACSGFVAQMKFDKALFATEKGQSAFITIAKTYFAHGGQQLSINVLDRATLLAAKEHPEQYQNLIVRVGGYSDYFCNLTPELQQNIIDRTSFAV